MTLLAPDDERHIISSVEARHSKRIGLNAHLLNLSGNYRSAGISWYIFHLLQHLPAAEFDFTVFHSEPRANEQLPQLRLIQSRLPTRLPIVRILWEHTVLPMLLQRDRIELLHALAFAGPLAIRIPWVVTIYDLSFVHYPQSFNASNRLYLNWAVRDSMRRANRVIAISESTRRDLIARFGVSPEKVQVVYCGNDPRFSSVRDTEEITMLRARHRLPDQFILHVGTIEPRKNIVRLLRAFARARRLAKIPHSLVLIGARGWKYTQVDAIIEQEGLADSIIFAGYVPQEELPLWYRAADLFVYPSMYEGFGIPPLEAMASGTPVVASNASSLPEVVGDAALTVPPQDEQTLGDAIVRALQDRTLRQEMREKGLVQAAKFSWARAAQETVEVYRSVLSEGASHAAA